MLPTPPTRCNASIYLVRWICPPPSSNVSPHFYSVPPTATPTSTPRQRNPGGPSKVQNPRFYKRLQIDNMKLGQYCRQKEHATPPTPATPTNTLPPPPQPLTHMNIGINKFVLSFQSLHRPCLGQHQDIPQRVAARRLHRSGM